MATSPFTAPTQDEYGNPISTHTWFSHWCRQVKLMEEQIHNYGRYVLPDYVGEDRAYLPDYINQLEDSLVYYRSINDTIKIAELENKLIDANARYPQYLQIYNDAVAIKPTYDQKVQELIDSNNVFAAINSDDALFIMDKESCDWFKVKTTGSPDGDIRFANRNDIIYLTDFGVDSIRIWNDNSVVEYNTVTDTRIQNEAHKDAVQIILPPKSDPTRSGADGEPWRMGDQMAGAATENIIVNSNVISAVRAAIQGVFASDGFHKNLKITNNQISTAGYHFITINGFLDGEISGNHLVSTGTYKPAIYVNSGRIGGNMADDGMLVILSFSDATYNYDPIKVNAPNTAVINGETVQIPITDNRGLIPCEIKKLSFGLRDFNFTGFYDHYNNLTLGQYKANHPELVARLMAWLNARFIDFNPANPRRGQMPYFPDASPEQINLIRPYIIDALDKMQSNEVDDLRLPELQQTALRSFIMKQLAILYGTVAPLADLGEIFNTRRYNYLRYLLPDSAFQNLVPNTNPCVGEPGYEEGEDGYDSRTIVVYDLNTHTPVQGLEYELESKTNPSNKYKEVTNQDGEVSMVRKPDEPFWVRFVKAFVTEYKE